MGESRVFIACLNLRHSLISVFQGDTAQMHWDLLPQADFWVFTETGHLDNDDLDFLKDKGYEVWDSARPGTGRHGGIVLLYRKKTHSQIEIKLVHKTLGCGIEILVTGLFDRPLHIGGLYHQALLPQTMSF